MSSGSMACSTSTARSSCSTTISRRFLWARSARSAVPGRREIGHGALAERSVAPILPNPEEFPLHDPRDLRHPRIQRQLEHGQRLWRYARPDGRRCADQQPGRRISVGLVKESDTQWVLLTDIIGDEDHYGDMDFKIAGTQNASPASS